MQKSFLSNQAKEFRSKYGIKNSPKKQTTAYQSRLISEEFNEFIEAESLIYRDNPKFREDALKELADLVYVCYQYAANMGWFLDEALDRVHQSNMSKLGENGKPIYREDGKVLKGPNYKEPNLTDLI